MWRQQQGVKRNNRVWKAKTGWERQQQLCVKSIMHVTYTIVSNSGILCVRNATSVSGNLLKNITLFDNMLQRTLQKTGHQTIKRDVRRINELYTLNSIPLHWAPSSLNPSMHLHLALSPSFSQFCSHPPLLTSQGWGTAIATWFCYIFIE